MEADGPRSAINADGGQCRTEGGPDTMSDSTTPPLVGKAPLRRARDRSFYNPESIHGWATETLECGHLLQRWIRSEYMKGPPSPAPASRRCDECAGASS